MFAAAMEFLKANPVDPVATDAFEEFCGVGVVITEEQIIAKVLYGVQGQWKGCEERGRG